MICDRAFRRLRRVCDTFLTPAKRVSLAQRRSPGYEQGTKTRQPSHPDFARTIPNPFPRREEARPHALLGPSRRSGVFACGGMTGDSVSLFSAAQGDVTFCNILYRQGIELGRDLQTEQFRRLRRVCDTFLTPAKRVSLAQRRSPVVFDHRGTKTRQPSHPDFARTIPNPFPRRRRRLGPTPCWGQSGAPGFSL